MPVQYRDNDAPAVALVAGISKTARQQILIDAAQLGVAPGTFLTSIAFRRDAHYRGALAGGHARATILLSHSPRPAIGVSPFFGANSGANPIAVFSGPFVVPSSPAIDRRGVSWRDPADVVEFAFQRPFRYLGGTLCLEIIGAKTTGADSPWWPVDGAADPARGAVTSFGNACGPNRSRPTGRDRWTALTSSPAEWVLGQRASVEARGTIGNPAVFLVDFDINRFPQPLPLSQVIGPIAGLRCELHTVGLITSITTVYRPRSRTLSGGAARLTFSLPVNANWLDLGVLFQALELDTTGPLPVVYSTNALECRVTPIPPSLSMATVSADLTDGPPPVRGRVRTTHAPVIRFNR